MRYAFAAFVGMAAVMVWLCYGRRDPLIHLVPFALAFPPIVVYGGRVLGWPGAWLSSRVALAACILGFLLFRLVKGDFSWRGISGKHIIRPHFPPVPWSLLFPLVRFHNRVAGARPK